MFGLIHLNWSFLYIAIVLSAMVVPVMTNRGSLPIFGVSMKTYRRLLINDIKAGFKLIIDTFTKDSLAVFVGDGDALESLLVDNQETVSEYYQEF